MHKIRQTTSKFWPIARKGTKYVVVPSHNQKGAIPLLIIMRDMLKLVKTRKELKKILLEKKILVNNKFAREDNLSLLLFDTLKLPCLKKGYRVIFSENKKINLEEISEKECSHKIKKIINKKILKMGKIQINFNDGSNILSKEKLSTGDSVLINLDNKKIEKVLPIKENAKIMIIKGKHIGKRGTIFNIEEGKIIIKTEKGEIETKSEELIVLE